MLLRFVCALFALSGSCYLCCVGIPNFNSYVCCNSASLFFFSNVNLKQTLFNLRVMQLFLDDQIAVGCL